MATFELTREQVADQIGREINFAITTNHNVDGHIKEAMRLLLILTEMRPHKPEQ